MEHRHIPHRGRQQNKPHNAKAGGSVRGKVENRSLARGASAFEKSKEQRVTHLNNIRKQKREDLLMKRRGLNFITD